MRWIGRHGWFAATPLPGSAQDAARAAQRQRDILSQHSALRSAARAKGVPTRDMGFPKAWESSEIWARMLLGETKAP